MEIKTMANETLTDVFSDIADAIRAKGVTGQMKPTEMSTRVAAIPQSAVAGDPRFDVNQTGHMVKKEFDITWFNDLTYIEDYTFERAYQGSHVTNIAFPELSGVGPYGMDNCFNGCSKLSSVSFPKLKRIGTFGMMYCF